MKYGTLTGMKREVRDLLMSDTFLMELTEQWARGEVLGAVVPPAIGYTSERATLDRFPSLEVLARDSSPSNDGDMVGYDHHLVLVWTLVGDDEERLVEQCETYAAATVAVMDATTIPDTPDVGPTMVGDVSYSMLGRTKGLAEPLVKAVAISVTVPLLLT